VVSTDDTQSFSDVIASNVGIVAAVVVTAVVVASSGSSDNDDDDDNDKLSFTFNDIGVLSSVSAVYIISDAAVSFSTLTVVELVNTDFSVSMIISEVSLILAMSKRLPATSNFLRQKQMIIQLFTL
jgi:hypothetical protein